MPHPRLLPLLLALIATAALFASCGSTHDDMDMSSTGGTGSGTFEITDAWARTTAPGQTMGAIYMTINGGPEAERLVGISVPADIAASASMHETVMADDASADDMDMGDGSMTMQQVDSVEIPAGGLVAFKPGGLHVMLMGLTAPLTAGQTFDMTLQFETAGAKRVSVTAKDG